MIVRFGQWESEEFDPTKTQIIKYGVYVPYGYDKWVILDEYIFWSHRLQKAIVTPRWFLTDLASIPRGFRWLISVNEPHRDWALPHDVWYAFGDMEGWDKGDGDLMFRDGLKASDIKRWKRKAMYQAVNLFGGPSWNKKEPRFATDADKVIYAKRHSHLIDFSDKMENGSVFLLDGIEKGA